MGVRRVKKKHTFGNITSTHALVWQLHQEWPGERPLDRLEADSLKICPRSFLILCTSHHTLLSVSLEILAIGFPISSPLIVYSPCPSDFTQPTHLLGRGLAVPTCMLAQAGLCQQGPNPKHTKSVQPPTSLLILSWDLVAPSLVLSMRTILLDYSSKFWCLQGNGKLEMDCGHGCTTLNCTLKNG